jgi:hypothetical protein
MDGDQLGGLGVGGLAVIKWNVNCSLYPPMCGNGIMGGQQA